MRGRGGSGTLWREVSSKKFPSAMVVREKVDIWRCRFEETFWDDFVLESSQVEKFPSITTRKRATTDRAG